MADVKKAFDRQGFLGEMDGGVELQKAAEKTGFSLANAGVEEIFLVACGAPQYMFRSLTSWTGVADGKQRLRPIYPSELKNYAPYFSKKTAVIFGSHSGTTKETVLAAEAIRHSPCQRLAITQFSDSLLGKQAQQTLAYGASKQGYFSSTMISLMVISAFMDRASADWKHHNGIRSSLPNLPAALADAKETSMESGYTYADEIKDETNIMVSAGGPMYTTAFVFAACFLMEMQRLRAQPINAYDFFHGPFEVLDRKSPILLLLGEDDSREEALRIGRFCDAYLGGCMRYDSANFEMPGIHAAVRPLVAPFIVDAALTNLVEILAEMRGFPMETRRYMGKVNY